MKKSGLILPLAFMKFRKLHCHNCQLLYKCTLPLTTLVALVMRNIPLNASRPDSALSAISYHMSHFDLDFTVLYSTNIIAMTPKLTILYKSLLFPS